MQVPDEMVEHVRRLMEEHSIRKKQKKAVVPDRFETLCEVKAIMDHRQHKGKLQFKLSFTMGKPEWVNDEDCLCEWLISQYLAEMKLSTAYIVCRVSTQEQAASTNLSMDGQEASIREVIPDGMYYRTKTVKIARSAYKSIPSQLVAIGEAANAGDAIYVYRVDRLSRNIIKFLAWLEDLNGRDVVIGAVLDQTTMIDGAGPEDEDESASVLLDYRNKRLAFIQAVLDAHKEAAILSQKMTVSMKRRRDRGDEHVGGLPYGKRYKRADDGSGRQLLVPDDELQRAVAKVRSISEKWSCAPRKRTEKTMKDQTSVADTLNAEGYQLRGKDWTRASIAKLAKKNNITKICWE